MNKPVQAIISTIFHPIFVNLLGLWLMFLIFPPLNHGIPEKLKYYMIAFVFITTGILPLILVLILKVLGKVQSITLQTKEERRIPYLATTLLYFLCYYNFLKINAPTVLLGYLLGCCSVVFLVFSINHFYKISVHTTTLGSLIGLILAASLLTGNDFRLVLIFLFLITGLVASARIFAKSHNLNQTILGFFAGLFIMFIVVFFKS